MEDNRSMAFTNLTGIVCSFINRIKRDDRVVLSSKAKSALNIGKVCL